MHTWHDTFSPSTLLKYIRNNNLIKENEVDPDSIVTNQNSLQICYLCSCNSIAGIILNNKEYLCQECFDNLKVTTYPKEYEDKRRSYLVKLKVREERLTEFNESNKYTPSSSSKPMLLFIAIVLGIFFKFLFLVAAIIGILIYFDNVEESNKKAISDKNYQDWQKSNPIPTEPQLKNFYDPLATVSQYDAKILRVFDYWPGYPPYWHYLRKIVLDRDNHCCQVTGCPSRLNLHIHHITPITKGGSHAPTNLITLCEFHHALEPSSGHKRIWTSIQNIFFSLVRPHYRIKPNGSDYTLVKAHIRRKLLINISDCNQLQSRYLFKCPNCQSTSLSYTFSQKYQRFKIVCDSCRYRQYFDQLLTEESGPEIAEKFIATKNLGKWKMNWDMLEERKSL